MIAALLSNLLRLLLLPIHMLRRGFAAPRGAYLTLEVDGRVADMPAGRSRFSFWRRGRAPISILQLRELVRLMARDPRVRGLLVHIRSVGAGTASLASLRDVLSEVRASGKDVVAYLPHGADTRAIYVASAARLVLVGPETTVAPLGYATHGHYLRRALDRVGVEPEVFAKGTYKSAGEVLVRDTMSEAHREQLGALLEAHHDALVTALSQGRRVDKETARRWIDEAPYSARDAVGLGLVDAALYEDEVEEFIIQENANRENGLNAESPPKSAKPLPTAPALRYAKKRLAMRFRPLRRKPVIGVIEVHGPILSRARVNLARVASEERIVATIRAARRNPAVRGVVLHIDSPGGSATASDRIYHEVVRLTEVKPTIAYLANVAASGGYYIASAAHAIVAQPQTITGSIGVVATRFVVGPLLERLGVFTDVVKRGARADLFSTSRRLDSEEREVFQRELDAFYRTFLGVVAKGRRRPIEEIEPLAEGRVYSGAEAHGRGLLDLLGGLDRALHQLRQMLGPAAKGLEPELLRSPRTPPPLVAPLPLPVAAFVDALGLGPVLPALELALNLEDERILAYWPGEGL